MQVAVMEHVLNGIVPADARTPAARVRAAAAAGIDAIEPFGGVWPADVDCRQTAEAMRRDGEREGVRFPVFGSNVRLGETGEKGTASVAALTRELEACQILGANVLTVAAIDAQPVTPDAQPGYGLPFERSVRLLLEPLEELAVEGARRGVRIGILTHSALVYLSWHQEWVVRLADHPSVAATVDPGNCLNYGYEDPVSATRRLASFAAIVRVADWRARPVEAVRAEYAQHGRISLWESVPLGEGEVDHVRCFQILRDAGYDGVLSLKSPGPAVPDAATALARAVSRLRGWAAAHS